MCKAAGKLIGHYNALPATKEYLTILARSTGIPIDLLVKTIRTGPNERIGTNYPYPMLRVLPDSYNGAHWQDIWIPHNNLLVHDKLPKMPSSTILNSIDLKLRMY